MEKIMLKKMVKLVIAGCLTLLSILKISAQDEPDGYASVTGKGLETTTGGEGGEVIIAESFYILSRYARSDDPYIIIVRGQFASDTWKQVNVGSNTTIVGYGTDATLSNIGFVTENEQNVIIRNLNIIDSYVEGDWDGKTNDNDGVRVDNSHHVWIDHCFFSRLGDGMIDLRKNSDYITVSYNQLNNHNKAFGVGWTDETEFHITIHHCWIDSTNQRNPSFDQGIGHLYNNYLSNVSSYGNLARGAAKVIVQNSHFYNTHDPLKLSDEAVLYDTGNTFEACTGNKTGNITSMPFDPADFYEYTLDPVEQVKDIVTENSGPQQSVSDQYDIYLSTDNTNAEEPVQLTVNQNTKTLTLIVTKDKPVFINIFNMAGQKVLSQQGNLTHKMQVELNKLKRGIYLVQLQMENNIVNRKIMLN